MDDSDKFLYFFNEHASIGNEDAGADGTSAAEPKSAADGSVASSQAGPESSEPAAQTGSDGSEPSDSAAPDAGGAAAAASDDSAAADDRFVDDQSAAAQSDAPDGEPDGGRQHARGLSRRKRASLFNRDASGDSERAHRHKHTLGRNEVIDPTEDPAAAADGKFTGSEADPQTAGGSEPAHVVDGEAVRIFDPHDIRGSIAGAAVQPAGGYTGSSGASAVNDDVETVVYDGNPPPLNGGSADGLRKIAGSADDDGQRPVDGQIAMPGFGSDGLDEFIPAPDPGGPDRSQEAELSKKREHKAKFFPFMRSTSAPAKKRGPAPRPAEDTVVFDASETVGANAEEVPDESTRRFDPAGKNTAGSDEVSPAASPGSAPSSPSSKNESGIHGFAGRLREAALPLIRFPMLYKNKTEKGKFSQMLNSEGRRIDRRSKLLFIIGLVMLVFDAVIRHKIALAAGVGIFGGRIYIYSIVNSVLLAAACWLSNNELFAGLGALIGRRYDIDTCQLFMYILAVIQNICSYFSSELTENPAHMYAAFAILISAGIARSRYYANKNAYECFRALDISSDKGVVRLVTDKGQLKGLSKALFREDSNVRYTGHTGFVSNFTDTQEKAFASVIPMWVWPALCALCALIGGIVSGVRLHSFLCGVSAALITSELSFPIYGLYTLTWRLSERNRRLGYSLSYVSGYDSAKELTDTQFVLADEEDILSATCRSIDTAKDYPVKLAGYCAYLVLKKEGDMFADAVKEYLAALISKEELDDLSAHDNRVEEFKIEGKGCSGFIDNSIICIGSVEFLANHDIMAPSPTDRDRSNIESGLTPLFVGIKDREKNKGEFICTLWFDITCDQKAADLLRGLSAKGIALLLRSDNESVTEEVLERMLNVPVNSIKVIRGTAGDFLHEENGKVTASEPAGAVHDGKLVGLLGVVREAVNIDETRRICTLLNRIFSAAGLVIAFIVSVNGGIASLSQLGCVIIMAVCLVVVSLVSGFYSKRRRR